MNRSRFAYFLNAVHYCIWLDDIKLGVFLRKFSSAFISLVLTICFTKKFKRRQEERMAKMQKIMNKFYYDKEVGYHIGWANHWFGYFLFVLFCSIIVYYIWNYITFLGNDKSVCNFILYRYPHIYMFHTCRQSCLFK